jgi:Mrp family chromosome partitioning ATPase
MGLEGAVGLTSVLLGRTSLDEALQAWGDDSLQVLASGPLPPNPSELLGSQGMQDLLRELEQRVDIVLIDAPPLLPVTDAAVLGTLTSGLVMLIRSNETRREQVTRAVATVHAVGATLLGGVLNMVPTKGPDSYSYGYGYGYSYKPRAGTSRLGLGESPVGPARVRDTPGGSTSLTPQESAVRSAGIQVAAQPEEVLPHLRFERDAPPGPAPLPSVGHPPARGAVAPPVVSASTAAAEPAIQAADPSSDGADYYTKASQSPGSQTWWEHAQHPQPPADNA